MSSFPEIHIHYLGHASFVLAFDNGVSVLTDYGQSRAYGLDSPIYDRGGLEPTVVTTSHRHEDHDRGETFAGAQVLSGESVEIKGIGFQPVPVTEWDAGDNVGYLITYGGVSIFHAGDCQGDMAAIDEQSVQQRLRNQVPGRLDLLLAPIGWTRDIVPQAAAYVDFLRPWRMMPMHYWSADEKQRFLDHLRSSGKGYPITEVGGPRYQLAAPAAEGTVEIVSLTPGPFEGEVEGPQSTV